MLGGSTFFDWLTNFQCVESSKSLNNGEGLFWVFCEHFNAYVYIFCACVCFFLCVHVFMRVYMCEFGDICVGMFVCLYACVCVYVCMFVSVFLYACVYMFVFVCACVYIFVCVCVFFSSVYVHVCVCVR